jgi:hypothetical protein
MELSAIWMVPLIVGGVGAAALAVLAKRLDLRVRDLERSLRPLRTTKVRRSRQAPEHPEQ